MLLEAIGRDCLRDASDLDAKVDMDIAQTEHITHLACSSGS